jgi:hypothetical protein
VASQRITVLKVAGKAAELISAQVSTWSGARDVREAGVWDALDWPEEIRSRVDALAHVLISRGEKLPILFWSQHVDHWSAGNLFQDPFRECGSVFVQIPGNGIEWYSYHLPDGDRIKTFLKAHLGNDQRLDTQEFRWFYQVLLEAVSAWERLTEPAIVIVIRTVVGGLIEDEQVESALQQVPDWLGSTCE